MNEYLQGGKSIHWHMNRGTVWSKLIRQFNLHRNLWQLDPGVTKKVSWESFLAYLKIWKTQQEENLTSILTDNPLILTQLYMTWAKKLLIDVIYINKWHLIIFHSCDWIHHHHLLLAWNLSKPSLKLSTLSHLAPVFLMFESILVFLKKVFMISQTLNVTHSSSVQNQSNIQCILIIISSLCSDSLQNLQS